MMDDFTAPLQDFYARAFPQRQAARIHDLTLLSRGWESDIYAFRAAWEAQDGPRQEDLVLRVYPGGDAYTKSAGEFHALRLLHRLGYPVPRVDCLERDASPIGMPFLIMERIHGRPLWHTMFREPEERRDILVDLFCGLLARLHALDWRVDVENPAQYEPPGPHAIVDRILDGWQRFLTNQPALLPGFALPLQWLLDHRHDMISERASIIHQDFHPENLLLRADDTAVVIDWTNFDISDYRFDLAWTLVLVCGVEGLHWREPLLRAYERQRGAPVEGLEFFEAAACLRRLFSVLFSLAAGAGQLGMRPGAEEEMRRQAPSLRRVHQILQERTGLEIPEVVAFLDQT
jgi:aminoglycoside phosphotransferase (APT) family kinase protein